MPPSNYDSSLPLRVWIHDAAANNTLPPTITLDDLITHKRRDGWTPLHLLIAHGHTFPGLTLQHYLTTQSNSGWTVLHTAAQFGYLPPGATHEILAECKDDRGWSALLCAAAHNHLPPNTPAEFLAQHIDHRCYTTVCTTALHTAARNSKLPDDTTCALLAETKDEQAVSAWQTLEKRCEENPTTVIPEVPPHLFQNHHELAIQVAAITSQFCPDRHSKAAIWLSKVLAISQQSQLHGPPKGSSPPAAIPPS